MKLSQTPLAFRGRIFFIVGLMLAGFVLTLAGYYRIQVLHRERYEKLGDKYSIKIKPIKANRGFIYDRNDRLITENRPTYNLVLQRDEMVEPWRMLRPKLSQFLEIGEAQLQDRYARRSRLLSQPVLLKENISFMESLRIKRNRMRYPGLTIETAEKRFYTYGSLFTHVLGFVGEASQKELEANPKLRMGDYIGISGVERAYDHLLTGIDGKKKIRVDHRGIYRSPETIKEAQRGKNLHLTLDFELQQLAMDALEGHGGSVVMMDVRSGELLVYISSPTYDLNKLSEEMSTLRHSEAKPFLNRPVKGAYAPGSVFKLVTALAALKSRRVVPTTRYYCSGSFTLYEHVSFCHNKDGHGLMDMKQALQHSCNVYFYNLARDLDINDLAAVAHDLGFGVKTGIDLVGEYPGLMPTTEWKRDRFNEIWYPGETLSVAIGQGALTATPIQLAVLMATIATNGEKPTPHFLLKSGNGKNLQPYEPQIHPIEGISREYFDVIKEAMWQVVNRDEGTGDKARVAGYNVCGKTGTAQLISFRKETDHKNEAYLNAWFAGFAPRDKAEVAVVVLVEQAGAGGHKAAPIAGLLFKSYREKRKLRESI